jgi:REP element-mobilizing transposase RayT
MRFPRLDFPGARHHVMNRGARREPVFADDAARQLFLDILASLPQRFGVRIHGFALMPNHYHLLVESDTGNLPRAMRHLGGEFARRLNREQRWDGPVFRGRYRNRLVASETYWRNLLLYVHLNPLRAGLSGAEEADWTSHRAYAGKTGRPPWLTTSELLKEFGSPANYLAAYRAVASGAEHLPPDFDARKLWSPDTTGAVATADLQAPLFDVADALAAVSAVTGRPLEDILVTVRGRHGNPANRLAAWWMSRHVGIPHGRIAKALFITHTALSKRIRRFEEDLHGRDKDAEMVKWVKQLAKWESVNT